MKSSQPSSSLRAVEDIVWNSNGWRLVTNRIFCIPELCQCGCTRSEPPLVPVLFGQCADMRQRRRNASKLTSLSCECCRPFFRWSVKDLLHMLFGHTARSRCASCHPSSAYNIFLAPVPRCGAVLAFQSNPIHRIECTRKDSFP